MFGVPLDWPTDVMSDNQGVVNNTTLTKSTLVKKHNAVNYHVIHKASAAGILRVEKEDTDTNLADILKIFLGWKRGHKILPFVLYLS